jgi:ABC-2 type transport system ATP-binding protein
VLAAGTLQELNRLAGEEDLVTVSGSFTTEQVSPLLGDVKVDNLENNTIRFFVSDRGTTGRTLEQLFAGGIRIDEISIREPNLESVFIKLTGRELRD